MRRAGLYALILTAVLLPSCDGESPTQPDQPQPPSAPSQPATVAVTATVTNANATASFFPGSLRVQRALEFAFTATSTGGSDTADGDLTGARIRARHGAGRDVTRDLALTGNLSFKWNQPITLSASYEFEADDNSNNRLLTDFKVFVDWRDALGTTGTAETDFIQVDDVNIRNVDKGACQAGASIACLNGGRFQVEVTWEDFAGTTGMATVAPSSTGSEGVFWFFSANDTDLTVKVLDNCVANDRFWVFAASFTQIEVDMVVTDTQTGLKRTYNQPLGTPGSEVTDTQAFATCPGPVPVP